MDAPGVLVRCPTCGSVEVDPAVTELYRDPRWCYGFATFLCCGCGELVATSCPGALAQLLARGAPQRSLRCTSQPRVDLPVP